MSLSSGCFACGYPDFRPCGPSGSWSWDICPCCSFHAGVDCAGMEPERMALHLRLLWLGRQGGGWWSPARPAPPGWDPAEQLGRLLGPETAEAGEAWADACSLDRLAALVRESGPADRARWLARMRAGPGWNRGGQDEAATGCFGPERWPTDGALARFRESAVARAAEVLFECGLRPERGDGA